MKHIESSKLIRLQSATDAAAVKYTLVERLRSAFHVETVGDSNEKFVLSLVAKQSAYRCQLEVLIKVSEQKARVVIGGKAQITAASKAFYTLSILALLVLGLFPGTINTSGKGNAMDFLVFLFLGVFMLYDIAKKLAEPEMIIDRVLTAVETEFAV